MLAPKTLAHPARVLGPFLLASLAHAQPAAPVIVPPPPPVELHGLTYDVPFFPNAAHNPAVPTPDSILGFPVGQRPASPAQVRAILQALAESPASAPRVKLFDYATSHQGRPLSYLAISSPSNIARLDQIRRDAARLADPRTIPAAEADALAESLPIVIVLSYTIHGDEMSGTDAALALAWHLAACTDPAVTGLLDRAVIILDPLMNPDGRQRCIDSVEQGRTRQPNVDNQSIFHAQPWPGGRMNHYLFDLNRDWIFATQPESKGRVRAFADWNPHYFVESHEQGALDTFLFMPPRAPINPNIGDNIKKWSAVFGDEQGKAFDAFGWRYYTGEWNEEWYPGYSGSWAALRGAIDNLYEQAKIISDGVRRPEGTIEPYREAVHKQLVASLANLRTAAANDRQILRDFLADRRKVLAGGGTEVGHASVVTRYFALSLPEGNLARAQALAELLDTQRLEAHRARDTFKASGRDSLGRDFTDRSFPAGTILISANQPLGRLAAALFETDPRMPADFLTEERRELLRFGRSRLYDITGWNVAMLMGIDVAEVRGTLPEVAVPLDPASMLSPPAPIAQNNQSPANPAVALAFDGRDDRSLAAAVRLMDQGLKVRATDKPTVLSGIALSRGSILLTRSDNPSFTPTELADRVRNVASVLGLSPLTIPGGMGPGDLPDLGGDHFSLLEAPRVAVLTREPFSPYSAGEIWFTLDHELGLRASYLDTADLSGADLRRYNVLIIPDGRPRQWTSSLPDLRAWTQAGGTLIALGSSAAALARDTDGLSPSVRTLDATLADPEPARAAIIRDYLGQNATVNSDTVWSHTPPDALDYPWLLPDPEKLSDEDAARRDQWRALFMPQGALLAARADDRQWLTAPLDAATPLPVLFGDDPVLMPAKPGLAVVRLGAFSPAPTPPPAPPKPANAAEESETKDKDKGKDDDKKPARTGWRFAPPGQELRLRMSGLLWPEAADRLAHAAYCTRERVGDGQLILFSGNPLFRGVSRGTSRIFLNAVVLGPGMGAPPAIRP